MPSATSSRHTIPTILLVVLTAVSGCAHTRPAPPAAPAKTVEELEAERRAETKHLAADDRRLAAEAAVLTQVRKFGSAATITFEDFEELAPEPGGNGDHKLRSKFAAEVKATEDLVVGTDQLTWLVKNGEYKTVALLRVAAPKGTKVLVTGSVDGKVVAGKHSFTAAIQDVAPGAGEVLPPRQPRTGFDPVQMLSAAVLRSEKEGVIIGSEEHRLAREEAKKAETERLEAERQAWLERITRHVNEVAQVITKLAAAGQPLVILHETELGLRHSWLFGESFSNVTFDPNTDTGAAILTDWERFPPAKCKVTIKRITVAAPSEPRRLPDMALAFEPEEARLAYAFSHMEGERISGQAVPSLSDLRSYGSPIILSKAEPRMIESMNAWEAQAAKVADATKIKQTTLLDDAGFQEATKATPFSDAKCVGARYSTDFKTLSNKFGENQPSGFEFSSFSGAMIRAYEPKAARSILIQVVSGEMSDPEVSVNGKPVPDQDGKSKHGMLIEFEEPVPIMDVRVTNRQPTSGTCTVNVRLCESKP